MRRRFAEPTGLTRAAFISSFAIIGFTMSYLIWMYPDLPFAVPVRLIRERAVLHSFKSPLLVMLPVLVQVTLVAFIAPLVTLLLWQAQPQAAGGAEDTRRMGAAAEAVALIGAVWIAVQAFAAVRLVALWERGQGSFGDVYTFVLVTAVAVSMVIGARTTAVVNTRRHQVAEEPGVWRLRRLYVNPGNPALFVPARTGLGYTLNFGRPLAVVVMTVTLGFGVIGPYYVAFQVLKGYWH
ncbi:MAG: DUF5808 domain-containing protein [Acidobacteria bacterium]|nr:DUF5808 domain-containing protein [Acidobacteriota bacterium]